MNQADRGRDLLIDRDVVPSGEKEAGVAGGWRQPNCDETLTVIIRVMEYI